MTPERRYEVAVHEAGHAVVALHYGIELRKRRAMTLEPRRRGGHRCGEVDGVTFFQGERRTGPVNAAVAAIAGWAAEQIYFKAKGARSWFSRAWGGSFDDRESALRHLHLSGVRDLKRAPNARAEIMISLAAQAKKILQPRWRTVLALARELAEKGSLDRGDVLRIVRRNHGAQVP